MKEREKLMKRIQVCGFVLDELVLYLDTHPTDAAALGMFEKYSKMEKEAKEDYVEKFGPINTTDYDGKGRWKWVDGPWPWQYRGEEK